MTEQELMVLLSIDDKLEREMKYEFLNRLTYSPRHDRHNVRVTIRRLKGFRAVLRAAEERDELLEKLLGYQGFAEARENLLAGYNKSLADNERLRAELEELKEDADSLVELRQVAQDLIDHIDRKYIAMKASRVSQRAMADHSMLRDLSLVVLHKVKP